MNRSLLLGLVLGLSLSTAGFAADPVSRAATDELPPALLAVAGSDAVMSTAEADALRARWVLNLNLPLVATRVQGTGSFGVNLATLSGGLNAGQPILIRIWVGR